MNGFRFTLKGLDTESLWPDHSEEERVELHQQLCELFTLVYQINLRTYLSTGSLDAIRSSGQIAEEKQLNKKHD